jgi:hypothetical protein
MNATKTMRANKAVAWNNRRANGIGYPQAERSNAPHTPGRGVPGGDLWAFDTMSRRAYPVTAGTKTGA